MNCLHEKTTNKIVEKKVIGEVFKQETMVCSECGAFLRDREYEASYMGWLEEMYKSDRSKFQIQCHLSSNLIRCAEKFLIDYPSVSLAFFFKALVVVFLDHIDINENLARQFDQLMDKKILESFNNDSDKKRVNLQFKPKMLIELISMSAMVAFKPSQIVESCIVKMMTSITTHDEKLKDFWEAEIMKYIDSMLKAA